MSDRLKEISDNSLVGQKQAFDSFNVFGVTVIDSNGVPKKFNDLKLEIFGNVSVVY